MTPGRYEIKLSAIDRLGRTVSFVVKDFDLPSVVGNRVTLTTKAAGDDHQHVFANLCTQEWAEIRAQVEITTLSEAEG